MLSTSGLACGRRGTLLFEDLQLELGRGQALEVHGPNGSGKTTLLRTLAGLAPALAGSVLWTGRDISRCAEAFRTALLWLGHDNGIEPELTAGENLLALSRFAGERTSETQARCALASVGLAEVWNRPANFLSQGQKRRVALARLWCTRKVLWLLDEPLAALDQSSGATLIERLRSHLRAGGMLVLATHQPLLPVQERQTLMLEMI